jgi:hypothetical protein
MCDVVVEVVLETDAFCLVVDQRVLRVFSGALFVFPSGDCLGDRNP